MIKDNSILSLLGRLESLINAYSLNIIDYWDADLYAIGLKMGNKLIYISSFKYRGELPILYEYDLEIDISSIDGYYNVVYSCPRATEEQLKDEIRKYFGDANYYGEDN